MEVLPPNASLSAFSSFTPSNNTNNLNDSHFFQPGGSAFSFEAGSAGIFSDGSYRSSVAASPSLFGISENRSSSHGRYGTTNDNSPLNPNAPSFATASGLSSSTNPKNQQPPSVQLWDLPHSASPSRGSSAIRTSSPFGGGRKPKEASRALRFPVATVSRDKGLVGLAKPPKEAEQGRVAVAGKTCLKLLRVPYGPSTRPSVPTSSSTTHTSVVLPSSSSFSTSASGSNSSSSGGGGGRSSSIAYRRSRSRGSPAPLDRARSGERFVGREAPIEEHSHEGDAEGGEGGGGREEDKKEVVEEVLDVRSGSRLGPAYLFSDVNWGFGATSNKLATSFTNGAVVLWDLGKEGGSHLDQTKYEHNRAVNRVVFGGQSGSWLMSGGQDGQMKLWDIRDSRPANMIIKAASPIRHISFSPSASQGFTLLAACESGTLIRYDLRLIGRKNGGATDRIAGHIGACLAMDWRDGYGCERGSLAGGDGGAGSGSDTPGATRESAGGFGEGGWVVTGGVDKTLKIWDFSQPTLSTKPARTLYASQAVHAVAWHPSRATEVASCPLPALGGLGGGGEGGGEGDGGPPTPTTMGGEPLSGQLGKERRAGAGAGAGSWKNEIEIWDVRRPYFPKLAIKTDEPTSTLLYNDDETIWATSKSTATFLQHDVGADSYALLDSIDRPAPGWNLDGDLAFVDDGRRANEVPFERRTRELPPANAPTFKPEAYLNSVGNIDPDFSADSFTYLAKNLQLTGEFADVCQHNAQACLYAERPDASQVWMTLRAWFDDEPFFPPDTPAPSPPPGDARNLLSTSHNFGNWTLSPTEAQAADKGGRKPRSGRPSFSSARNSRRSSGENTPTLTQLANSSSSQLDPHAHNNAHNPTLDAFSEESTAEETSASDVSLPLPFPELSSTSSDSEDELLRRARKLTALSSTRLAASLAALPNRPRSKDGRHSRSRSSTNDSSAIADDEIDLPLTPFSASASRTPSRLRSRRPSTSSSSGSDLDGDNDDDGGSSSRKARNRKQQREGSARRSRSQKIASLHATLVASRSRRPSSGAGGGGNQNVERRRVGSREGTNGTTAGTSRLSSRQQSVDAVSMSRRGSVPFSSFAGEGGGGGGGGARRTSRLNSADLGLIGSELLKQQMLARKEPALLQGSVGEELYRKEGEKHTADALEIVKTQLLETLKEYADRGDAQLCAAVCCVMRDKEIALESLWVARVTKTYLDLLRRLNLHVPAAKLNKYCSTASLRTLTQNTVVFHTSCGSCGKAIDQAPFGYCTRCSLGMKCCICHHVVRSLYVFCACCGHGAHSSCLEAFAASLATGLATLSAPQTPLHDHSHPSTPGIATPIRAWLWGEGSELLSPAAEGGGDFSVATKNLQQLATSCPAACGHSPCVLSSVVL